MIQMELKEDLAEETERNKDGIMHLEVLRKHYDEQEKAYGVFISLASSFTFIIHSILQEVQTRSQKWDCKNARNMPGGRRRNSRNPCKT